MRHARIKDDFSPKLTDRMRMIEPRKSEKMTME